MYKPKRFATLISIHALLAESDRLQMMSERYPCYFYPRSPCGERLTIKTKDPQNTSNFYPRSPCGERLIWLNCYILNIYFYPRSPCGERHIIILQKSMSRYFYPRSPCGERPNLHGSYLFIAYFYPRSPCGERLRIV